MAFLILNNCHLLTIKSNDKNEEVMWSRHDIPALSNSSGLKYTIYFLHKGDSVYGPISIYYGRLSVSWLTLELRLKDVTLLPKLENALTSYEIDSSNKRSDYISISGDANSLCAAFRAVNSVVPIHLPEELFSKALHDISNYVIPADKRVPWKKGLSIFDFNSKTLEDELLNTINNSNKNPAISESKCTTLKS